MLSKTKQGGLSGAIVDVLTSLYLKGHHRAVATRQLHLHHTTLLSNNNNLQVQRVVSDGATLLGNHPVGCRDLRGFWSYPDALSGRPFSRREVRVVQAVLASDKRMTFESRTSSLVELSK